MARRGKTAKIDLEELEKLSSLQCTDMELASWFRVSVRTIERRRREAKFGDAMERGKARGRMSIRRAQFRMLDSGNPAIAIFLGKNYLGQTDYITPAANGSSTYIFMPQVSVVVGDQGRPAIASAARAAGLDSEVIEIEPGE